MSTYAKRWIGGLVLILALLCITPLVVGWRVQCVMSSMVKQPSSPSEFALFDGLNLTPEQKEKIQILEKDYEKQTTIFCQNHCSARMKIAEVLKSKQPDIQTLSKIQNEVSSAYSASEELTLQHVLRVSEILTPDQRATFLKKYSDHIEATCPLEFVR